ncbi:MAG: S8/S53 family peptidase [Bacilli bacterium]|nr:S8/S53 family peptidase [Bacilli bacterium]
MKRICFLFLYFIFTICLSSGSLQMVKLSDKISFASYSDLKRYATTFEISQDIIKESEKVVVEVVSNSNFNYDVGDNHNLTSEEVKRIKNERKQLAAKYFTTLNKNVFNQFPLNNFENLYISKYFPIVSFEIDSKQLVNSNYSLLNKIADIKDVKTIEVKPKREYQLQSTMVDAFETMNAYNEIYNGTLTGNGVVVGVLDGGIVDVDNPNFENKNVTVRNHLAFIETVEQHATAMASIIILTAPNASILSVEEFQNISGELDWMLDRDVDIVNMSFGESGKNGYTTISATVDHFVKTYGVTCCVSAGNYIPDEGYYVANPGLAYNAVTLGNSDEWDRVDAFSCYQTINGVDKPTLSNIGGFIDVPNVAIDMDGTSLSAAFTSGAVAMLMEQDPTLKLYPARVTALLTSSSYMNPDWDYLEDSYLDDEGGAGVLDFGNAKDNINNYFSVPTSSTDSEGDVIYTTRIYMEVGDEIRMSLCWLANSSGSVSSTKVNDYELSLCRPAGAEVQCTWGSTGTVDMINYTAEYTGNYWVYVVVTDNSNDSSSQTLFVNWSIE